MKRLMKIGLASSLGLALAIPACAQHAAQTSLFAPGATAGTTHSVTVGQKPQASNTVTAGQKPILIGTLGTTSGTASVATIVALGAAEAASSTGHTR